MNLSNEVILIINRARRVAGENCEPYIGSDRILIEIAKFTCDSNWLLPHESIRLEFFKLEAFERFLRNRVPRRNYIYLEDAVMISNECEELVGSAIKIASEQNCIHLELNHLVEAIARLPRCNAMTMLLSTGYRASDLIYLYQDYTDRHDLMRYSSETQPELARDLHTSNATVIRVQELINLCDSSYSKSAGILDRRGEAQESPRPDAAYDYSRSYRKNIPSQHWKIFVSFTSEFELLIEKVDRAIGYRKHFPCHMYRYVASDNTAEFVDIKGVEDCHVYIGIYGSRYGSLVEGNENISYTEQEFDTACQAGLFRLIFIDETAHKRATSNERIVDENLGPQSKFINKVLKSGLIAKTFKSKEDLLVEIERALETLEKEITAVTALEIPRSRNPNWEWAQAHGISSQMTVSHFTGRAWLFEKICSWANSDSLKTLLLTAEYGFGKTAFISSIIKNSYPLNVCASYFFESHSTGSNAVERFLKSLTTQLAISFPDYKQLIESNEADQLRALISAARESPMDCILSAVCRPLSHLKPRSIHLILVDGIDEYKNQSDLIDVLECLSQNIPQWIRLIITCRPRTKAAIRIERFALDIMNIPSNMPENSNDIKEYVIHLTNLRPKEYQLENAYITPTELADTISNYSFCGGKFLYAYYVLEDIRKKFIVLDTRDSLEQLPRGMNGFYHHTFTKRLAGVATYAEISPLLGLICVQKEPIREAEFCSILQITKSQLVKLIQVFDDFLVRVNSPSPLCIDNSSTAGNRAYLFEHRSLSDWLDEQARDQYAETEYSINLESSKKLLQDWVKREGGEGRLHAWPYIVSNIEEILAHSDFILYLEMTSYDFNWISSRFLVRGLEVILSDLSQLTPSSSLNMLKQILNNTQACISTSTDEFPPQLLAGQIISRLPDTYLLSSQFPDLKVLLNSINEWLAQKASCAVPLTNSNKIGFGVISQGPKHERSIIQLQQVGDGLFLSASIDGSIKLWELKRDSMIETKCLIEDYCSYLVASDGELIMFSSSYGTLKTWDIVSNRHVHTLEIGRNIIGLCMLGMGKVAFSCDDGTIYVFNYLTRFIECKIEIVDPTLEAKIHQLRGFCHIGDNLIAIGYETGEISIWDTVDGCLVKTIVGNNNGISHLFFGGGEIIMTSFANSLSFWSRLTAKLVGEIADFASQIVSVSILNESEILVFCYQGEIYRCNLNDFSTICSYKNLSAHRAVTRGAAMGEGKAVIGHHDGRLEIIDLNRYATNRPIGSHSASITGIASLTDSLFITSSRDGRIILRRVDEPTFSEEIISQENSILAVTKMTDDSFAYTDSGGLVHPNVTISSSVNDHTEDSK